MFDPTIGRWFQEDPKGFAAGDPNLFRYVHNSPTNAIDASGLEPVEAPSPHTPGTAPVQEIYEKEAPPPQNLMWTDPNVITKALENVIVESKDSFHEYFPAIRAGGDTGVFYDMQVQVDIARQDGKKPNTGNVNDPKAPLVGVRVFRPVDPSHQLISSPAVPANPLVVSSVLGARVAGPMSQITLSSCLTSQHRSASVVFWCKVDKNGRIIVDKYGNVEEAKEGDFGLGVQVQFEPYLLKLNTTPPIVIPVSKAIAASLRLPPPYDVLVQLPMLFGFPGLPSVLGPLTPIPAQFQSNCHAQKLGAGTQQPNPASRLLLYDARTIAALYSDRTLFTPVTDLYKVQPGDIIAMYNLVPSMDRPTGSLIHSMTVIKIELDSDVKP
jgi:hypothetical protein